MKTFNTKLNQVLQEDVQAVDTPAPDNPLTKVKDLADRLQKTQTEVADLQRQYACAIEQMNGQLAIGIKHAHPRLNAALRDGGCSVGYKSKSLQFRPDLDTMSWKVESPDKPFVGRFAKHFGDAMGLEPDFNKLIEAITKFFSTHYQSL